MNLHRVCLVVNNAKLYNSALVCHKLWFKTFHVTCFTGIVSDQFQALRVTPFFSENYRPRPHMSSSHPLNRRLRLVDSDRNDCCLFIPTWDELLGIPKQLAANLSCYAAIACSEYSRACGPSAVGRGSAPRPNVPHPKSTLRHQRKTRTS